MLGLINDNIDASIISNSSISDLVDSIYGGINTDINALTSTLYDGTKIYVSIRQQKKVLIFTHGHGSIYVNKVFNAISAAYSFVDFKSFLRVIYIAPASSNAIYLSTLTASYFTNPNDAVINKIRSMTGMNSLIANTAVFTNDNSSSHGFIDYFKNIPSIITTFNTKKG